MVKEVFRQEYETESGDIEEEILITHEDFLEGVDQAPWLIMAPEADSLEYGIGGAAMDLDEIWGTSAVTWIYKGRDPVYELFEEHVEHMEFTNGAIFSAHKSETYVTGTSKYAGGLASWTSGALPENISIGFEEEMGFETVIDHLCETTLYIMQGPEVREKHWDAFGSQIFLLYTEDQ